MQPSLSNNTQTYITYPLLCTHQMTLDLVEMWVKTFWHNTVLNPSPSPKLIQWKAHLHWKNSNQLSKKLKTGKSPGPDGVLLQNILGSSNRTLLTRIQLTPNCTPPTLNLLEAHISFFPKTGKDPTSVTNYRPISLLNVDIKIFAKTLANYLLPALNSLIMKDPVGFIPVGKLGTTPLKQSTYTTGLLPLNNKDSFFR